MNPDLDYWVSQTLVADRELKVKSSTCDSRNPHNSPSALQVEMLSEEGDLFYYHTETNVTQWQVPEGPDVVILSMDDLKKVIDPNGGGAELAISNRV